MDIAKFNKELGYRVAKAKGLENTDNILRAIDEWVIISEMVINASKVQNLEFTYKSMLIEKLKQIIDHIKDLKLKLRGEQKVVSIEEDVNEIEENVTILDEGFQKDDITDSTIADTQDRNQPIEDSVSNKVEPKIIEQSEFKNIPNGFKEIEPSEDFKIITPHNKNHVEKIKREAKNNFTKNASQKSQMPEIKSYDHLKRNKLVCFACGAEIPINSEVCPQCGAPLKK